MTQDKYNGNDNYGKPKSEYLKKLAKMDDNQLFEATKQMIWLSAYASNNPKSDYHWQCDACYDECQNREDKEIYNKAYQKAF